MTAEKTWFFTNGSIDGSLYWKISGIFSANFDVKFMKYWDFPIDPLISKCLRCEILIPFRCEISFESRLI